MSEKKPYGVKFSSHSRDNAIKPNSTSQKSPANRQAASVKVNNLLKQGLANLSASRLKALENEIMVSFRENEQFDWQNKESAQACIRIAVRRILRRYHCSKEEIQFIADNIISVLKNKNYGKAQSDERCTKAKANLKKTA